MAASEEDNKDAKSNLKREGKKPRRENQKDNEVAATGIIDEFKLKQGEVPAHTFKKKAKDINVVWEGECKMCPRWFILGKCWKNCPNVHSHAPVDQVPAEKKESFTAWMA